ncbi:xylitol oxidase [Saccharothrix coeruleofusca]|uniref:FAD-binding protein n=1 Tax=Saccharothrix coeruleofusca TaxID=33919 RepID=UPI001AE735D3|nr:FAD-binding protein [Saccharothrix coeruleofusca]MBP2336873.1 xylitol oxidase [Saccharothrix coeruleofusca]
MTVRTNWAGNFAFSAERVLAPASVEEVQRVVAEASTARVVGTGHSFNRIADTTGTLISLEGLPEVFEPGADTARVGAGMKLARLAELLHSRGLALPTMPSLPHITLAGACTTATHGSGNRVGSFADMVRSVDLVTADGSLRTLRRGEPGFEGAVVSLGALGAVVALEVAVQPDFDVEQRVHDLPWDSLVEHVQDIFATAYSVSAFTLYRGTAEVWVKRRLDDEPADLAAFGGRPADGPRHPVPGQPALHCTPQLGEPGPWHERLPHFRADFTPSVGEELQSEYFVAREHAADALRALAELGERFAPVLLTSEIRTVDADEQWLSPVHGRPGVAFHFTWRQDTDAVLEVLRLVEQALAPWSPRPHWGKLFALAPEQLRARYQWSRFADLLEEFDAAGKFRNELVTRWCSGSSTTATP